MSWTIWTVITKEAQVPKRTFSLFFTFSAIVVVDLEFVVVESVLDWIWFISIESFAHVVVLTSSNRSEDYIVWGWVGISMAAIWPWHYCTLDPNFLFNKPCVSCTAILAMAKMWGGCIPRNANRPSNSDNFESENMIVVRVFVLWLLLCLGAHLYTELSG